MPTLLDHLKAMQSQWSALSKVIVWLVGILGAIIQCPPVVENGDAGRSYALGLFIVTVVVALLSLAGIRCHRRKHGPSWLAATLLCVIFGVYIFVKYNDHIQMWSTPYYTSRVVTGGSSYTADGIAGREKYKEELGAYPTTAELVMYYGGAVEEIWPKPILRYHQHIFLLLYVGALCVFAAIMVSLVTILEIYHVLPYPAAESPAELPSPQEPSHENAV